MSRSDARGRERGPDILSRPEIARKTGAEHLKILTDGRTAEGVPAFASCGSEKPSALVAYLRTLQDRSKQAAYSRAGTFVCDVQLCR
jgi:hypothetical protein